MSADTFEFDDRNHAERFVGTLHDPAATPGDVLTVQADKSIAAAPGGGSMPIATRIAAGTIKVGANPQQIAANSDGSLVACPNEADGTVSVIETTGWTVTETITVGGGPFWVAFSLDDALLACSNQSDGTVSIIETTGWTVVETVTVGTSPTGVAFRPDGGFLACANADDGTVSIIETTGWTVTETVTVGAFPTAIPFSPDGTTLAVCNSNDGTVSIIETTGWTVTETVSVCDPGGPEGGCFNADGSLLFLTTGVPESTVLVVETTGWTVTQTIAVGSYPYGIAVDLATGRVVTANQNDGTVSIIDPTLTSVKTVAIGAPDSIGVTFCLGGEVIAASAPNEGLLSIISRVGLYALFS